MAAVAEWRGWTEVEALYAAIGAGIVALVTGIFTFIAARPKARADTQSTLNSMFELVLKRLDGENIVLKQNIATLRQTAQRQQSELRQHMFQMREHIIKIEQILRDHGIPFEPLGFLMEVVDGDPQ